jgi:methylmalonyl-CoA mutase cobalamin-binding domain/chain
VKKGRIVMGTVTGDTHDIGKNIVELFLSAAGFEVRDLGKDVSARTFVDQAVEFGADIIAVSTLMTTTMRNMKDIIDLLETEGIRDKFKVIIGGKPTSLAFAEKIGADGYSENAIEAVRLVDKMTRKLSMEQTET